IDPLERHGKKLFVRALRENEYDLVWIQIDIQHICSVSGNLKDLKKKAEQSGKAFPKIVYHVPVDMSFVDALRPGLEVCDAIVPYSEFGKREILRIAPDLADRIQVIGCSF